jgi:CheY-like chemotaxis protein
MTNLKLPESIQGSPVALVVVNGDDEILAVNNCADNWGLTPGMVMTDCVSGLRESFTETVRFQSETATYQLRLSAREKRIKVTLHQTDEGFYAWLFDISEQLALAEQIRRLKLPDNKSLRQINQYAISALGYAELLDVIMDDSEVISGDKLAAVIQYQKELSNNLKQIQQLADREKLTADKVKPIRASVLVADGHKAITELITELLQTEGYKVVSFSDAYSVLKYFAVNGDTINKAVIDEKLTGHANVPLIDLLRQSSPDLPIISLTDQETRAVNSVQKPLDFHSLLSAIED